MRFVLRSLLLSALLALPAGPAHADKKQDAEEKKKHEEEKKKHEAEEKKKRAEEKKKHEAEKKKQEAEEKKKHEAEKKRKHEEEKKKHEAEEKKRKHEAEEKKHEAAKHKHHAWHGMIVKVDGSGGKGSINIKHANGGGKTFDVDDKSAISGIATAFGGLKKGQIVTVHYLDKHKHAAKVVVDKQAEKTPVVPGKDHHHGTVEKIVRDKFGDNGDVWIKDNKGKTTKFHAGNETNVVWRKDGKDHVHTLQGVSKGQKVEIRSTGHEVTHITVIMK